MIDFNLNKGKAILNNDVDLILQQIDMLFDTTPNEVLGFEDYGTKYDYYLYNLNVSAESLKNIILNDINSLELFGFNVDVDVQLFNGSERDIIMIYINLYRNTETYQKTYKIL